MSMSTAMPFSVIPQTRFTLQRGPAKYLSSSFGFYINEVFLSCGPTRSSSSIPFGGSNSVVNCQHSPWAIFRTLNFSCCSSHFPYTEKPLTHISNSQ